MKPGHGWKELDGPYYPLPSARELVTMARRKREEISTGSTIFPPRSLVIADRETDMFIGVVSWSWESEETRWPGVGIVIYDESHWGKGIGYEALGLWTGFLFHALPDIARLDLRTWSGNRGMMRLAEKLGYVEEARFRRARIVDGKYYDGLGYGILREEWESRHPHGFVL
jgi:putative hydrolase of HD superfamily